MPFDSLVMAAVARDIGQMIGARITKVYQPRTPDVVLVLRKTGPERRLLISSAPDSARIHFTGRAEDNPKIPPMFCMLLRKHLEGARLAAIGQPRYERVMSLSFEGRSEMGVPQTYTLVAEIMGRRSNIILLDERGTIVDAVKRAGEGLNQAREVMPGRPYIAPPSRPRVPPDGLTTGILRSRVAADPSRSVEEIMVDSVMGVGPALARHVCAVAGLDRPGAPEESYERAVAELGFVFDAGSHTQAGVVYCDDVRPFDYYCMDLAQYAGFAREQYPAMSAALDAFFARKNLEDRFRAVAQILRGAVRKALERAASRLDFQHRDLNEGMRAEEYRLYGELLTAYGTGINRASEARVPNYYAEGSPEVVIPLDPSKNGPANAQAYFRRYSKAKAAREQATTRIRRTEAEIAYLEQVSHTIDQSSTIEELMEIRGELAGEGYVKAADAQAPDSPSCRCSPSYRGPRSHKGPQQRPGSRARSNAHTAGHEAACLPMSFASSEGYEILAGRNNRQNDEVTRSAKPEDVWLHARQMPGAHVVLRYSREAGKPPEVWPTEASLLEAASVAAYYSRGRGNTRVAVDFTFARHVWKPRGAKPGMMLYDHQKTLSVEPRCPSTACTPPTVCTPR